MNESGEGEQSYTSSESRIQSNEIQSVTIDPFLTTLSVLNMNFTFQNTEC